METSRACISSSLKKKALTACLQVENITFGRSLGSHVSHNLHPSPYFSSWLRSSVSNILPHIYITHSSGIGSTVSHLLCPPSSALVLINFAGIASSEKRFLICIISSCKQSTPPHETIFWVSSRHHDCNVPNSQRALVRGTEDVLEGAEMGVVSIS